MTAARRGLSGKGLLKMWGSFTRSGAEAGVWHFESHHTQTDAGHGLQTLYSSCQAAPEHNTPEATYLAKEKPNWSVEQWSEVLFSDETNFAPDLEIKVQSLEEWRSNNPRLFRCSVKFPEFVLIWRAMSSVRVDPLFFIKSRVNAAVYQEILEHFMLPSAEKLFDEADVIFQQDLAPDHTVERTKTWFNDQGVTVLDCPANSPNLPIKKSMVYWQEEEETHETEQCIRVKSHY